MYNEKLGATPLTLSAGTLICTEIGYKNIPYPSDWIIHIEEPLQVLEVTTKAGYLYPALRTVIVLPVENGGEFLAFLALEETPNLFWIYR